MAAKPVRSIVCEGKDDVAVFHALLKEDGARPKVSSSTNARLRRFETDRLEITVEERGGKSKLAELVLDTAEGTAGGRPDWVLLSFDPDRDLLARELAFFERDFEDHRRGRAGPLVRAGGRLTFRVGNRGTREVTLIPAPWRSIAPACFAGLPEEQCIERILVEAILAATPPPPGLVAWAEESMKKLHALVEDHGHKRAFRLWNAALKPDVDESFVVSLFQMHETKGACLTAVRATPAYNALRTLLDG